MKNLLSGLLLSFIYLTFPGKAFAQSLNNYNSASGEVMAKGIDGIGNIVSSIITDSFTPMTHYKKGELDVSAVPAWFNVDKVYDSPEIKGDGLKGYAGGAGAGYAASDDLMIYAIAAFMDMQGKLKGDFYKELPLDSTVGPLEADMDYNLLSFVFGAGYDILGGKWSMPVFAGLSLQYYDAKIELPTQTVTLTDPPVTGTGTLDTEFSGSGLLYGANAGIAVSREFMDLFKITPYFLYTISFNKAELDNETTFTTILPAGSYESKIEGKRVSKGMLGLCLTLLSDKGFSFSLSLGGLLTSSSGWYNDEFLNGLKMKSVVAVFTYTTDYSEAQ